MSVASLRAEARGGAGGPMSETRMSGGIATLACAWPVAAKVASGDRPGPSIRPRLGVVNFNPIQYHAPIYQLITRRGSVHRDFGDAVAMVGWFCQHGFAIDLRDNAGTPVPVTSDRLDYAYFRRA